MEDTTGGLWQSGALRNKPAGLFTSTATQGGGQEATCLTGAPCMEPSRSCQTLDPNPRPLHLQRHAGPRPGSHLPEWRAQLTAVRVYALPCTLIPGLFTSAAMPGRAQPAWLPLPHQALKVSDAYILNPGAYHCQNVD